MAEQELWPVDEINPDDSHCLSLMQIRALCERIVDPQEMDRLRMNRISWFNYLGEYDTRSMLVKAALADIINPNPQDVAGEEPDPLAKFGPMAYQYPTK